MRLRENGDLSVGFVQSAEPAHGGVGLMPVGYAKDSAGMELVNHLTENQQVFYFEHYFPGPVKKEICQCDKCVEAIRGEQHSQIARFVGLKRVPRYDGEGREIT